MQISAIIPVFNEEDQIIDAIESVSWADEIIVVDTGSTDNTAQIAKSYNAKVFNFKWIDDFSAARNESLLHANHEWILTLDADEYLDNSSYDGSESEVTLDDYYARSRGIFFGFLFSIVLIFLLIMVSTKSYFYFEFIRNLV